MTAHASLETALRTALGDSAVTSDPAALARFAVHSRTPGCATTPPTAEALAVAMRLAHEHGATVVPWGGGTQQHIGAPPEQADLVVSTEQLNRVLIYEPDDLTISVEAGMTLGALQALLAERGQMLPNDAPLPNQATIGGLLATAMDGPRRLGYGTLRDLLIGVGVVEVSGRVSKAGGMVVKNVSGFDMMKLYYGSYGTLAVITSANFKLLPRPREWALLLCRFTEHAQAWQFIDALQASQLTPAAAEYLNADALAALGVGGNFAVAVRAEGLPQAVERHRRDLAAMAARYGGTAEAASDADALWAAIVDLPQTARLAEGEIVCKLAVLPGELPVALARIESLAPVVVVSARALDGVAYVRLQGLETARLRKLAELAGVQWLATTRADAPRWGGIRDGMDVMRRIKNEFDPNNQLNRGRFVVG